ncbi:MAG TPA: GGDEF domain-containing protein [Solirubrobacterales bacterium]
MSAPSPPQASPRIVIRRLFDALAERDDPYAGADRENAVRIVALILSLSGLLTAVYLPLGPPTAEIGGAGWVVAALVIVASIVAGGIVRRRGQGLGFNALLAITYLGIVQTALMTWLSGGWFSPYSQVLLLWIGTGAGIHPPRRAVTVLVVAGVAAFLPLAYEGWSAAGAERTATEFLIWSLLGLIVLTLMTYVRAQRVAMRDLSESAEALARVDPLTGLGNRRAFDETLELEIDRARASGTTLSIALLDLDGFKELNDRLGHLEGDRCLEAVAAGLKRAKRAADHVFRWGGDEFAVILPGAAGEQASAAVTRITDLDPVVETSDGRALSFCCGLAQLDAGMSASDLLERADLDLFSRKRDRPSSVERV